MNTPVRFDFQKDDRIDGMTVIAPVVRSGNGDLYLVHDETGRQLVLKVIRKPDNDCELTGIEKMPRRHLAHFRAGSHPERRKAR